MKTLILTVLLGLSHMAHASTVSCQGILSKKPSFGEDLMKTKAFVFRSLDGQRQMAYRHVRPTLAGKSTKVIVHGLGDSMEDMLPLFDRYLSDGHGVLLVDQYGHGETLDLYLANHSKDDALKDYSYMNNAQDLHDLIVQREIENFYLMGHSLGGNVVFFTAAKFAEHGETQKYKLRGLIPMSPYAGRSDKYYMDYMRSPEYWVESPTSKIINVGADGTLIDALVDPYYRFFALLKRYPKFMRDVFYNLLGVQKLKDAIQDPFVDKVLIKKYREYFTKKFEEEKQGELTEEDRQEIELKAKVALGIAKMNRSIDLLNSLEEIPKIDVPILILAARNDKMVLPAQMKEFNLRLEKEGLDVSLKILNGPDADHFFVQKIPEAVEKIISEYFEKKKSERAPK